jgi:N-methylhydantoinase A
MVNLRMVATGARERPRLPLTVPDGESALSGHRQIWFIDPEHPQQCPVYFRPRLHPGETVEGPAVVEEPTSTTLLWEGDVATVSPTGELIVEVGQR